MDTIDRSRALEQRYGTRRPGRRYAVIALSVLIAVAGLGWLAWAAWVNSHPAIAGDVVSFDVKSTHRVDTTVQWRLRNDDIRGSCQLRASAADHSSVGELSMPIDGGTSRQRTIAVHTERRATSVEVLSCSGAQ